MAGKHLVWHACTWNVKGRWMYGYWHLHLMSESWVHTQKRHDLVVCMRPEIPIGMHVKHSVHHSSALEMSCDGIQPCKSLVTRCISYSQGGPVSDIGCTVHMTCNTNPAIMRMQSSSTDIPPANGIPAREHLTCACK